jgi:hypothetical protein
MRGLLAALCLLAAAVPGAAGDRGRSPDVDVLVPVEPYEHERLHYFGRRHHHLVPGTVTINREPYVCDLDGRRFTDREAFIAHLRVAHRVLPERIPDLLLVRDGRVHFLGEK